MPKRNLPDWFPGLRAIDQMDQKEGGRRRGREGRRELVVGGVVGREKRIAGRSRDEDMNQRRFACHAKCGGGHHHTQQNIKRLGWNFSTLVTERTAARQNATQCDAHRDVFCFLFFFTAFPQSCCPHNLT